MKKTSLILALALILSVAAKAQNNWAVKQLDNRLSVKFPSEPQKVIKNGNDSYMVKEKDSVVYSAGAIDLKLVAGLDSVALAPLKDKQQFADQVVLGIASQKPTYTFGDVTVGKWNNYTTYNATGVENTTKNKLFIEMIIIGSKMYSLSCRVPANLNTKNNELFLSSPALLK
ncbi:MAG: hypothetical protein EOO88_19530 [Pedobacter sp.]|nr:MAG: hypothetical protein EOO88_19530 [Pedobacter sp.]